MKTLEQFKAELVEARQQMMDAHRAYKLITESPEAKAAQAEWMASWERFERVRGIVNGLEEMNKEQAA